MEIHVHLMQLSRKGSVKQLTIDVDKDSNIIKRSSGLVGAKQIVQPDKEVLGKNIGKANETSPHQQAIKDAESIINRKIKEGYVPKDEFKITPDDEEEKPFSFYPLPIGFAPSKPISKPPEGVNFKEPSLYRKYFWEKKNNGVNLLSVTDMSGKQYDYTRGIEEITHIIPHFIPVNTFKEIVAPNGTIISYELIYVNPDGYEDPKMLKGIVANTTTKENSTARFLRLISDGGIFQIKVFDVLFYNGEDVTKQDYSKRREILNKLYFNQNPEYMSQYGDNLEQKDIDNALDNHWEGFILREAESSKSHIEYTLNGKPYRRGAYKLKFEFEDDYFIYETQIGESGRLKGKVARFHLGQYDSKGNIIDICWAGPGNIKTEDMDNMASMLNVKPSEMKVGKQYLTTKLVALVKYQSKQIGSNALEFPVIKYIRNDKKAKDCLYD